MDIYIEKLQDISVILKAYIIMLTLLDDTDMVIESMIKQVEELEELIGS